jgi:NAD(P)-dependent dehydrogenase (short-subunit alcohol dehydrogenase family)
MLATLIDLHSLAEEIRSSTGGEVLAVPADIGDRVQIEAALRLVRERLGAPKILLYNAGSAIEP